MIRVRLSTDRHATVHVTPSWLQRFFGAQDQDFEVELLGREWCHGGRPVTCEVAGAIEAEATRAWADRLLDEWR